MRAVMWVIGWAVCVLHTPAWAQSAPTPWAQYPLLQRETRGLMPNVMLTLEDSSSMLFQHWPEDQITLGASTVTHPLVNQSVRFHPADTQTHAATFAGSVAGVAGTTNWRQKFMRSAQTNWTFYNPEVLYQPWPSSSGARMPSYPASAAPLDPMAPTVVVNLTLKKSITDANELWCFRTNTQSTCAKTTAAVSFDPGLYFVLKTVAGVPATPTLSASYTEYSINTGTSFPKYPARTDCTGSVCTQAQEQQNFAHWFTYSRSRALMIKGAVAEAFTSPWPDVRLGWGRINQTVARAIDGVSTTVIESGVREGAMVNFLTWLYALPSNGSSPWAEALRAVGAYVQRSDASGPWATNPGTGGEQLACRRQHHLTLMDGPASGSLTLVGNVDNVNGPLLKSSLRSFQYKPTPPYKDNVSGTLADHAMALWNKDLRPDLPDVLTPTEDNPAFWQHLVTHVVGLGVNTTLTEADLPALTSGAKTWGAATVDELWHTALNSRGQFSNIRSASALTQAMQAMLAQAIQTRFETGAVAAREAAAGTNRWLVSSATSHAWSGDVQAFALSATGQVGAQLWSAQAMLPPWTQRKLWTWRNDQATPAAVPFAWDTLGPENQNALGAYTANRSALVDYVRGDRSREGEFRVRQAVLGDIPQAPLVVGAGPDLGYSQLPAAQGGASYAAYLTFKAQRVLQVVTGGNDGMLHVFQDSLGATPSTDGREVFAYVPRAVLPLLSRLADPGYGRFSSTLDGAAHATYHRHLVAGPLSQTDAYLRVPGSSVAQWRNLVFVPLGAGGPGLVALDMTDPAAPQVLWDIAGHAALGLTQAPLVAGVLPNGEWVAVWGNGPYSPSGQATLMVVNLQTGALQTVVLDEANALGGVALRVNSSGQISALYAGDAKGQVWRLDANMALPARFGGSGLPLFQARSNAGLAQAITQAPLVLNSARGGVMVVVATGRLDTDAEADALEDASVYGIWDKPLDNLARPLQRQHMAPRRVSSVAGTAPATSLTVSGAPGTYLGMTGAAVNWASQRGYVVDVTLAGARVLQPLQALNASAAWVSVVVPSRLSQGCEASPALSVGLLLNVLEGTALPDPVADTNGDGLINALDTLVVGIGKRISHHALLAGDRSCLNGHCDTPWVLPGSQTLRVREAVAQTGARVVHDRTWRRLVNPPWR